MASTLPQWERLSANQWVPDAGLTAGSHILETAEEPQGAYHSMVVAGALGLR